MKIKEEKIEKKVEFNNVSSIKLFQNSEYGEAWVTILENIPTNINDYFRLNVKNGGIKIP